MLAEQERKQVSAGALALQFAVEHQAFVFLAGIDK
jgi:hypothetical protein